MINSISFSGILKPQINYPGKPVSHLSTPVKDSFEANPLSKTISYAKK